MAIFEASEISFSYGRRKLFERASLSVQRGNITGLLGPNGTGKTTFFDLICGLERLHAGSLRNPFARISYLSQTLAVSPVLKMADIFKMVLALTPDPGEGFEAAREKLSHWSPGIAERYAEISCKRAAICSYGERRWFLALSLLSLQADFYIMDEPTAGVDPEFRHHIWRCLREASAQGSAVLVSSHNVDEIAANCDSFYMLDNLRFNHFTSGSEYMDFYGAQTLDMAFVNSTVGSFHRHRS